MHKNQWLLAEAKNKLTEVVNQALKEPQVIQRRQDTVVVVSIKEYERLLGQSATFKTLLLNPPSSLENIVFERDKTNMRPVSF